MSFSRFALVLRHCAFFFCELLQELALTLVTSPFGYTIWNLHNAFAVEYVRGGLKVQRYLMIREFEGRRIGEHSVTALIK